MEQEVTGVRESRRRAMLARSIADQFSGPRAQLDGLTRKNPFAAVAVAFSCGVIIGMLAGRRK